ncbi:hypothetical protein PPERSA_07587 [Pseudocohnilembus persalinus]|uniref:Transmembrane protein 198 n=1 Tax=Pseudocohnilembus persalinus TaxID=266149 RepID=A0A0V0QIA5_PSEPJ|nr:hypothetical protein PPERSA_07587 [Pseudocohnilembus persalinus]|eukprot:KRX01942.1 hypothetical protein PPERSA_07587 [Pseudocohnilembus persalinus]
MSSQKYKKRIILAFTVLFFFANQVQSLGTKCNQYIGDSYFTLDTLKSATDYNYTMDDGSIIYWNFCQFAHHKCSENARDSYALVQVIDGESGEIDECTRLTSDQQNSDYSAELIDKENAQKGIKINIKHGDTYEEESSDNQDEEKNWQVRFIINCKKESDQDNSVYSSFNTTNVTIKENTYIIEGESEYGCPVLQLSKIWEYLGEHKALFAVILVSVGILECFFGYKLLKPTLFIIGYATGFGILVAVLGEFIIGPDSNSVVVWVILIITIVFGALLGYLTMAAKRFGFMALGFWLGVVIAFLLNNAFLYKIDHDSVVWITIIVLGCIFAFASCILHQHIVIISTSLVGAYAIIRPVGWVADGFPNEFTVVDQIRHGVLTEIPTEFYLFLALIILLAGIGMKYQYYTYYQDLAREQDLEAQKVSKAEDDFSKSQSDESEDDIEKQKEEKNGILAGIKNFGSSIKDKLKGKKHSQNSDLDESLLNKDEKKEKINKKQKKIKKQKIQQQISDEDDDDESQGIKVQESQEYEEIQKNKKSNKSKQSANLEMTKVGKQFSNKNQFKRDSTQQIEDSSDDNIENDNNQNLNFGNFNNNNLKNKNQKTSWSEEDEFDKLNLGQQQQQQQENQDQQEIEEVQDKKKKKKKNKK